MVMLSDADCTSFTVEKITWLSFFLRFPKLRFATGILLSRYSGDSHTSCVFTFIHYLAKDTFSITFMWPFICEYVQYHKYWPNHHHYQDREQTHFTSISSCFSVMSPLYNQV
jgi:hypothetical protein